MAITFELGLAHHKFAGRLRDVSLTLDGLPIKDIISRWQVEICKARLDLVSRLQCAEKEKGLRAEEYKAQVKMVKEKAVEFRALVEKGFESEMLLVRCSR